MFAVISWYERPGDEARSVPIERLERGDGAAEVAFVRHGDRTTLDRLYQRAPCRVLFPTPEPGDLPIAALLTTSGGLTGGDRARLAISVDDGARALVTTAAAEKIYRSLSGEASVEVGLDVGRGGWLEWLPQETILFDRARLKRRIVATLAGDASLLAVETLVFGRAAHGERFAHGLLHESWRIRGDNRLRWADAIRLEGDVARMLDAAAGFGGARAMATAVLVSPGAEAHLPLARRLTEMGDVRAGATVVNGILLARFLAETAERVRAAVARYVAALRQAAAGLPAAVPRLWST